jgi:polyhydroxyalkanoate synthesis repressor PhaR
MRVIKKYGNRRLYDTSQSSYINLENLIEIIRGGEEVQVVDVKTGEDLTRYVLLQALMEASQAAALFPPGLLHRILRYSGNDPFQRVVMKQVGMGLEMLDAQLTRMEQQLPWMQGAGKAAGWPPKGFAGAKGWPPAGWPGGAGEAPEEPPEEEPEEPAGDVEAPPPAAGEKEAAELAALRERLAALESRLKE